MTRMFVCKQIVILFHVLFVLVFFLSFFLICCWPLFADSTWIKFLLLWSEMSLKISAEMDACSFKVAIYFFFYDSTVGSKELENDRENSWRWWDWSRAFLQERSLTQLAPGVCWMAKSRWVVSFPVVMGRILSLLFVCHSVLLLYSHSTVAVPVVSDRKMFRSDAETNVTCSVSRLFVHSR